MAAIDVGAAAVAIGEVMIPVVMVGLACLQIAVLIKSYLWLRSSMGAAHVERQDPFYDDEWDRQQRKERANEAWLQTDEGREWKSGEAQRKAESDAHHAAFMKQYGGGK